MLPEAEEQIRSPESTRGMEHVVSYISQKDGRRYPDLGIPAPEERVQFYTWKPSKVR